MKVVLLGATRGMGRALAQELADGPSFGLETTKEMLNREASMSLEQALEAEAQAQALCMRSPDFRESHQAFVEKRDPDFRGRGRA